MVQNDGARDGGPRPGAVKTVYAAVGAAALILGALGGMVFMGCFSTARPQVQLDTQKLAALKAFDYADWDQITRTHVDDRGRVNYAALRADRSQLDRFVALLGEVGPTKRPELFTTRPQQLAYYINAYNALTMFNVINRLPRLKSVNDQTKDFFYFTRFRLDGAETSLYKLENDLIRPRFREPRVHFALNCASAGCPVLPAEPFLPDTLEAQLRRETSRFLHDRRNVTVEQGEIVLSKIFEWYEDDFEPDPVGWIRRQASDLQLPEGAEVRHRPYDWALNAQ